MRLNDTNMATFGFIGTGNMGGALAKALAKSVQPARIFLADRAEQKAKALAEALGCKAVTPEEIATECDYIFLGVKPQMLDALATQLRPILDGRSSGAHPFVLVTMAAGVSIEKTVERFGAAPIIRIMPNTPVSVGQGVVLYAVNEQICKNDWIRTDFCDAMKAAGRLDQLDEQLIDAGCALSGCGPAFVYLFIEALADGAVACGLPRDKALAYAAQTVGGAAEMVLQSGKHPGELKDMVCSPGGTTIAGVAALESLSFRGAAMRAVLAAYQKTLELGK